MILVDCHLGEDVKREFHVFVSCHWCAEVVVFDVDTHEFGIGSADNAVAEDFESWEVCCACGEFARVCDEVAAGGDTNSVGICFLGVIVDDDVCVCHCVVPGNGCDLVMGEDEESVGSRCVRSSITLGEITKFFSKCSCPCGGEKWVSLQCAVVCDCIS